MGFNEFRSFKLRVLAYFSPKPGRLPLIVGDDLSHAHGY